MLGVIAQKGGTGKTTLSVHLAVQATLETGETLVAEAGTGTGKTYAYLVPALLSGRKVVISTGTRNLQDQLFLRDLPRLRDAVQVVGYPIGGEEVSITWPEAALRTLPEAA